MEKYRGFIQEAPPGAKPIAHLKRLSEDRLELWLANGDRAVIQNQQVVEYYNTPQKPFIFLDWAIKNPLE